MLDRSLPKCLPKLPGVNDQRLVSLKANVKKLDRLSMGLGRLVLEEGWWDQVSMDKGFLAFISKYVLWPALKCL